MSTSTKSDKTAAAESALTIVEAAGCLAELIDALQKRYPNGRFQLPIEARPTMEHIALEIERTPSGAWATVGEEG